MKKITNALTASLAIVLLALTLLAPSYAQTGAAKHKTVHKGTSAGTTRTRKTRHHATAKKAVAKKQTQVWLNDETMIYHMPGTRWYGTTKNGRYIGEDDARKMGARCAENGQ